ncbi:hypothetical protein [Maritimibacter sp. UBA3975]|uniref:hypothetical protein n=1 Tax=Maritimibacter sp. UBA3975 TaxID=1946833 RepID=UPI000C0A5542|nr:hypothetical protein [Maritimibacter sp. UBA3975]MAM63768.1 hypothetical protein [Maritimibacter sp.]
MTRLSAALVRLALAFAILPGVASGAPNGFENHVFNGRAPVTQNGVVTLHVEEGDCSSRKYGDGRGESDCFNGNLRSRIAYRSHANLGQSLEYAFEVMVPAGLRYGGGPNRRSLLEIAEWQRLNTIKNHIHTLHLDSVKGISFDDTRCIPPGAFGSWRSIKVQVKWAAGEDGFLQVICDGKPVIAYRGQTAIPRDCGQPGVFQCVPDLQRVNQPVQFQLGILFRGYGERARRDGLNRAGRMPPAGGFTIQMRNIRVSRIKVR